MGLEEVPFRELREELQRRFATDAQLRRAYVGDVEAVIVGETGQPPAVVAESVMRWLFGEGAGFPSQRPKTYLSGFKY